jgi:hypothetical protein
MIPSDLSRGVAPDFASLGFYQDVGGLWPRDHERSPRLPG